MINSSDKITVSFLVPTYKFSKYIEECVDSILEQKVNFEIEILISDDFSQDGTIEILNKKYGDDPRIKIFERNINIGGYENIKFLFDQASGKYISYLDGDDYLTDEHKTQKQVDFLEDHPDYVMHSTGNIKIDQNGNIPEDGMWRVFPIHEDLETRHLIRFNFVGFGRLMRNVKGIIKPWMTSTPYLDWFINFEYSLLGKIKCDKDYTGAYRIAESGVFSALKEEEKERINILSRKIIMDKVYEMKKTKKIVIIDCFIRNQKIESKLSDLIDRLRERGNDILLISNTPADKTIIERCNFYIYDNRNQLFEKEYTNIEEVDFFTSCGEFVAHNINPGLQRHGLSVLINLFNATRFAKMMGYTHFRRLECDDIFGKHTLESMDVLETQCLLENKNGIFYFNENESEKNISFHYFFCDVEYFQNKIEKIENESDYIKYLLTHHSNLNFIIAEKYIYENLRRNSLPGELVERDGVVDIDIDFKDTVWNTETSNSNLPPKYNGCISELYKKISADNQNLGIVLYSQNFTDKKRERSIRLINDDGSDYYVNHTLNSMGSWAYVPVSDDVYKIEVYEEGDLLYKQMKNEIKSYLKWE
jgi:glycosyltransferase involved in cell wall biosynthesis